MNEKNFVGLSADGEFIACGSEQNEVHLNPAGHKIWHGADVVLAH